MRIPNYRAVAKPETLLGLPPLFFYVAVSTGAAVTLVSSGKVFYGIIAAMIVALILFRIARKNLFVVEDIACKATAKKPRTAAPAGIVRFVPAVALLLLFPDTATAEVAQPQAPLMIDYLPVAGLTALIFGLIALLAITLTPHLTRFLRLPPVDSLRARVPFDKVETDSGIIHLSTRGACIVIAVPGLSDSLQDQKTADDLFHIRQHCMMALSTKPVIARFVTIRHKHDVETPCLQTSPILRQIHHRWEAAFAGAVFRNDHFILLSTKTPKRNERRALIEAATATTDFLDPYKAEILRPTNSPRDPLFSFLYQFINCYARPIPAPPEANGQIDNLTGGPDFPGVLSSATVDFYQNSPTVKVSDAGFTAYQTVMSWHGLADDIAPDSMRAVLRQPCELMLIHTASPKNTETLPALLTRRRNQAAGFRRNPAIDQDFVDVIEAVQSERDTLFTTQSVVIVQAETPEALQTAVTALKRSCTRHHATLLAEPYPLSQELWFDRFPGNDNFRRPWNLTGSYNAILASFEDEPTGIKSTAWSEYPVRVLPTIDGTLYNFNFQDSDASQALGHFCVIAPSESGKTTFINFLLAGAANIPDVAAFVFDSQQGARHALTLFGGEYTDVTDRTDVQLNPLQVDDTPRAREQLRRFITQLSDAPDAVSQAAILRTVNSIFEIPDPRQRNFNELMEDGIDLGTPFREGMEKWTTGGRFAGWFNAPRDSLDFGSAQLFGFEMAQALKDPDAAAALIDYISYRIREHSEKTGLKHIIFCDEAARLFEDPNFARNAKAWFRESRKLDGVIGVAFQEPNALADLGIQETIWDNCATFILFPNRQARRADYEVFQLTEPQWEYISGNNPVINQKGLKHSCMLIRPTRRESVILDIDLNRLGPLVRCFRSGTEANAALQHFRATMGDSVSWEEEYLQTG